MPSPATAYLRPFRTSFAGWSNPKCRSSSWTVARWCCAAVSTWRIHSSPLAQPWSRWWPILMTAARSRSPRSAAKAPAARWLLTAHDRGGNRLELTQESLAGLLGVQRTTVNAVARELQDEGLITTRRGIIEVHDREGLERRSCECYDRVERFFGDMVGPKGRGRKD